MSKSSHLLGSGGFAIEILTVLQSISNCRPDPKFESSRIDSRKILAIFDLFAEEILEMNEWMKLDIQN